jgi:hypothetical protein
MSAPDIDRFSHAEQAGRHNGHQAKQGGGVTRLPLPCSRIQSFATQMLPPGEEEERAMTPLLFIFPISKFQESSIFIRESA